jgi:hypothetical protein
MPMGPGLIVPGRDKQAAALVQQTTQVIGQYAEQSGGLTRVHFADGRYMTFNPPISLATLRKLTSPLIDSRLIDPAVYVSKLRREVID